MPGQGYHGAIAKKLCTIKKKRLTNKMKAGNWGEDAHNSEAGGRRRSHFCGGAGIVLPQYNELRQRGQLQTWDSGLKKSYLVDPEIDMELFEAASRHLKEDDYKDGIRIHLLTDKVYDNFIQKELFDVSKQQDDIILFKKTGLELDGVTFRRILYDSYPMLDQYAMRIAGITEDEIAEDKNMLRATFSDSEADFIIKYLNYDPNYVWHDNQFFNKEMIEKLIDDTVETIINYMNW